MSTTCLVRQLQYIQYVGKPGKLGKILTGFPDEDVSHICGLRSVFCVGVPGNVTSPLSELMAVLYTKFDEYRRRIVPGRVPSQDVGPDPCGPLSGANLLLPRHHT